MPLWVEQWSFLALARQNNKTIGCDTIEISHVFLQYFQFQTDTELKQVEMTASDKSPISKEIIAFFCSGWLSLVGQTDKHTIRKKQVRLSRATLKLQVLQVPTGVKVFNNQVIYQISFTKIFRSKKSCIQDLSLPKKVEF